MSYSVTFKGTPEEIKTKLAEESTRLTDQSKQEFDAVKPALETLLDSHQGDGLVLLEAQRPRDLHRRPADLQHRERERQGRTGGGVAMPFNPDDLRPVPKEGSALREGQPMERMQPPPDRMLQFFQYAHLPEHLQRVSKPYCDLAHAICAADDNSAAQPSNPERTAGLRKLLEAKDCAVRALLYKG